jgi:preprotein translocase subunit SecF
MPALHDFLDRYWKPLTFTTIVVFLLSFGFLLNNFLTKGEFIERDAQLSGGKEISVIVEDVNLDEIQKMFPDATVKLLRGVDKTLIIEVPFDQDEEEIINGLQSLGINNEPTIKVIGPVLGKVFWEQAQLAIFVSFIAIAIVVFLLFKSFVPTMAVLLSAVTDATVTLTIMDIVGLKLSLAVIGALLMLVGYSVDTDVLLTARLSDAKKEDITTKVMTAAKTGLTMSGVTLIALFAMLLFSGSSVLEEIAIVLIIGLLIDIPSTWLTNAGILHWWLRKRER